MIGRETKASRFLKDGVGRNRERGDGRDGIYRQAGYSILMERAPGKHREIDRDRTSRLVYLYLLCHYEFFRKSEKLHKQARVILKFMKHKTRSLDASRPLNYIVTSYSV